MTKIKRKLDKEKEAQLLNSRDRLQTTLDLNLMNHLTTLQICRKHPSMLLTLLMKMDVEIHQKQVIDLS